MSSQTPALTISSLPNELLEAIAAAGQEGRDPDLLPAFKSEWILSHVSRRFRSAIIGAPALWTLVEVGLHVEGSGEILKLYLERSRACTISATLQYKSGRNWPDLESEGNFIAERLGHIILHINRIGRLRLVVKEWGGELLLDPFRELAALNLQHLEVVNRLDQYDLDPVEIFSGGTPTLKFLKMYGLRPQLPLPQWAASLTHLELRRDREDGNDNTLLVETLAQCPLLVDLYLDISFTTLEHRFHIPSLKSLYIMVSGTEDAFDFLGTVDMFDTPSLTEFAINGVHGDQIFELFDATSLPHASFPALSSFCFVDSGPCQCETRIPFPQTTSSPPLRLFPALSSLSLINECFTPNVVNGILCPSSHAWPVLKTVTLSPKVATATGDVRGAILDVARSHRQHGLPLPKFNLCAAVSSLEDWQGQGIDVEVFDAAAVRQIFWAS